MRLFKDCEGTEWQVAINVTVVKRVRDVLQEDLLEPDTVLKRLLVDPILLCDVLYVVCRPQAEERGLCDLDFGARMGGDTLRAAKTALVEEIVAFFPDPDERETLARAVAKTNQLVRKQRETLRKHLDSPRIEEAVERKLTRELEAALSEVGGSSTSLPASSASIPAP